MSRSEVVADRSGLLLGVDGGGTKSVACLAVRDDGGQLRVLGEGRGGPGNPRGQSIESACHNISQAIDAAFAAARRKPAPVPRACLALAGVGDPSVRGQLEAWAGQQAFAARTRIVHDAEAVLAAASSGGDVVALISGTGSLVFGRRGDGRTARAGGWGPLLGDEGSGYDLGLQALRSVCRASDGRASNTALSTAILDHLGITKVEQLHAVFPAATAPQHAIADLARFVTAASLAGDEAAIRILGRAASQLAQMVLAVVRHLELGAGQYSLALSGGVLIGSPGLCADVERRLNSLDAAPASTQLVVHPVRGALQLACQL